MIVIGLGNDFRHDDAVGLVAARSLRTNGLAAEEHAGDLAALMDRWRSRAGVILIDAVWSGAGPGTIHYFDISVTPLQRERFRSSTHALGLADAVELSRALGTLPPRVYVFGVEVRDVRPGVGLSPEVKGALPVLINEVVSCTAESRKASFEGPSSLPSARSTVPEYAQNKLAAKFFESGDARVGR